MYNNFAIPNIGYSRKTALLPVSLREHVELLVCCSCKSLLNSSNSHLFLFTPNTN
nr:hypothetical protein Q903MT_gene389 [Picea sitchensis]